MRRTQTLIVGLLLIGSFAYSLVILQAVDLWLAAVVPIGVLYLIWKLYEKYGQIMAAIESNQ